MSSPGTTGRRPSFPSAAWSWSWPTLAASTSPAAWTAWKRRRRAAWSGSCRRPQSTCASPAGAPASGPATSAPVPVGCAWTWPSASSMSAARECRPAAGPRRRWTAVHEPPCAVAVARGVPASVPAPAAATIKSVTTAAAMMLHMPARRALSARSHRPAHCKIPSVPASMPLSCDRDCARGVGRICTTRATIGTTGGHRHHAATVSRAATPVAVGRDGAVAAGFAALQRGEHFLGRADAQARDRARRR